MERVKKIQERMTGLLPSPEVPTCVMQEDCAGHPALYSVRFSNGKSDLVCFEDLPLHLQQEVYRMQEKEELGRKEILLTFKVKLEEEMHNPVYAFDNISDGMAEKLQDAISQQVTGIDIVELVSIKEGK